MTGHSIEVLKMMMISLTWLVHGAACHMPAQQHSCGKAGGSRSIHQLAVVGKRVAVRPSGLHYSCFSPSSRQHAVKQAYKTSYAGR